MKDNYKDLFNINPKYSATSAFILGLVLIDSLTTLEQNAVGEWFILVGQTLVTNSGFQAVIESRISGNRLNINSKEIKSLYNPFIYDIKKVKKLIKKLYPSFQSDIDSVEKILSDLQSKIKDIKKE
jgi:hypothetical protein